MLSISMLMMSVVPLFHVPVKECSLAALNLLPWDWVVADGIYEWASWLLAILIAFRRSLSDPGNSSIVGFGLLSGFFEAFNSTGEVSGLFDAFFDLVGLVLSVICLEAIFVFRVVDSFIHKLEVFFFFSFMHVNFCTAFSF